MNADEGDRAAILRSIEQETAAYFNKDYEAWARCWVQEPYARRIAWYARGGAMIHRGWESEAAEMRLAMKAFPTPNRSAREVRRENINVRIGKDIAWVTFEQVAPLTGDAFDAPGRQHEGRILEKQKGEWKIAVCFVVGSALEMVSSPLMQLDHGGRVVWKNTAATAAIKDHPAFGVAGGRLRARDPRGDQRLQASIRWAAGLKTYADMQNDPHMMPSRRGALPVILDESDASVPNICWVIVDAGMTLVSFDDEQSAGRRLESAAIVYGLTPAQVRLATLIVTGNDLVDAARRLGVSVNTARTQLQRMFDKTGTRGQPALVRALLTVATPLV